VSKLISIAGSSGVGKTTLARLLMLVFPSDKSVIISGDNYHKWERGNSNWKYFTHLNPAANNLDQATRDLSHLKEAGEAWIPHYSHRSGKLEGPVKVKSKDFIIYEGLHALYGSASQIADVKIFVDTEPELKMHWKMVRDTASRGYSATQVLAALKAREEDEAKFIKPQKSEADIVIRFKVCGEKVVMEYEKITCKGGDLIPSLCEAYEKQAKFIDVCGQIGANKNLVGNRGGNISYKLNDKRVITSSGAKLAEVSMFKNHWFFGSSERPSMESEVHQKLGEVVIHTHPKYVNVLLCSTGGREIVDRLFSGFPHRYIPYVAPGKKLAKQNFGASPCVYFLENHGLVVSADTFEQAWEWTEDVCNLCKEWVNINKKEVSETIIDKYLFPDAVLFEEEMMVNKVIAELILSLGLTPKYLTSPQVHELKTMEEEKYRRSLK
jgi:uridine kinase/ribulose-5-phosphate 4-epimerase/fuculose-1-phosphate aldolase